ncbi:MAG: DUF4330 domain-containing protein [Candidatus Gastranaerophilales bacterium]|nr:DUF4330 domain-containing protein [Candidatus Gastranaerophilales bacterium]
MNLLKKLRLVDYIIIFAIIVLVCIGTLAVFKKKNFANLPIEKETKIHFDVFFRGITLSSVESPFKQDENAFITIRNVPYTKLKIVAAVGQPRMTIVPAKNKVGFVATEDISMPNLYDFMVKLEDTAKKTPDGFVAGGNKIKMGIPVVIEGETYKYSGTISNVYEVVEEKEVQETQEK